MTPHTPAREATLTPRQIKLIDALAELDLNKCSQCNYTTKSATRLSDHTIIVHTLTEHVQWVEAWGEYAAKTLTGDHVTAETAGECLELKHEADRIWSEHTRRLVGSGQMVAA